jgi:hypothetical protein
MNRSRDAFETPAVERLSPGGERKRRRLFGNETDTGALRNVMAARLRSLIGSINSDKAVSHSIG